MGLCQIGNKVEESRAISRWEILVRLKNICIGIKGVRTVWSLEANL